MYIKHLTSINVKLTIFDILGTSVNNKLSHCQMSVLTYSVYEYF